jgi:hypothetical protein
LPGSGWISRVATRSEEAYNPRDASVGIDDRQWTMDGLIDEFIAARFQFGSRTSSIVNRKATFREVTT